MDFQTQPIIIDDVEKYEKEAIEKKKERKSTPRRSQNHDDEDVQLINKIADTMTANVSKILSMPTKSTSELPSDVRCFLDYLGSLLMILEPADRIDFQKDVLSDVNIKVSVAMSMKKFD